MCGFDVELCLKDLSLKLNHFYKRCVSITVVIPQALLRAKEGSLKSTLLYLSKTLNFTECLGKGHS